MNALFDLTGQVAVVTGASRGLGQYFGRALAKAGADLVVTSRHRADLEPFVREIEGLGRQAIPVALDVRDPLQHHCTLVRKLLRTRAAGPHPCEQRGMQCAQTGVGGDLG